MLRARLLVVEDSLAIALTALEGPADTLAAAGARHGDFRCRDGRSRGAARDQAR